MLIDMFSGFWGPRNETIYGYRFMAICLLDAMEFKIWVACGEIIEANRLLYWKSITNAVNTSPT